MSTGTVPDPESSGIAAVTAIELEIRAERARLADQYGQDLPDGTCSYPHQQRVAMLTSKDRARAAASGELTWHQILRTELAAASAETDPAKLRTEVIHLAAAALAWAEAIDRREITAGALDGPVDVETRLAQIEQDFTHLRYEQGTTRLLAAVRASVADHEPTPVYRSGAPVTGRPAFCGHDPDNPDWAMHHKQDEYGWVCLAHPIAFVCRVDSDDSGDAVVWPCPHYITVMAALLGEPEDQVRAMLTTNHERPGTDA
ncbi:hypothetical protein GCM10023196_037410 [Actinoallomurus vinaceus]|uniref:DUF222 domain-containing protein n=1 Tax=Actinoallomurus vinaceus TaxID=1080074 RepID=A0ABP8U9D9_9ACTN